MTYFIRLMMKVLEMIAGCVFLLTVISIDSFTFEGLWIPCLLMLVSLAVIAGVEIFSNERW